MDQLDQLDQLDQVADPLTVDAIARARQAHARSTGKWVPPGEDTAEAEGLCSEALAHLAAGRWDDALACAEVALSLAEAAGRPTLWREFALLVEEAAETGR